jgi:septation ring formation regulator EzrA
MQILSTAFNKLRTPFSFSIMLSAVFLLTSISCANPQADSLNKDSQKYLSFYENVDGEKIHWEANFFDGEITSIYKNGNRIPDDLVADYKEKVYQELDEMRYGADRFSFWMPEIVGEDFHFDMEELHKNMEEMKKDLPKLKENFHFHEFDSKEFEKQMEELKKELEENKDHIYKFRFDDKEFKEEMEKLQKELKENLPKLKKFKFEFDIEEEDTEV